VLSPVLESRSSEYINTQAARRTTFKMQAIKLGKKYPEFKQEEIFDLINKFQ
jgi:hypothetical protein